MRVTHVVARAFGPFHGERLELAPGMTVVTGPNESGKSSWHAALRLALTGLRRGRGRATAADAALSAQHRPWDTPDAWEVEAGLVLNDGRAIELRHMAQARHAEHLAERARVEESARMVKEANLQLDLALAAQARHLAAESDRRASRASALASRYPQRPTLLSREGGADLVAAAITAWERRPASPELVGPPSAVLAADLQALPPPPDGDVAPHPHVTDALRDLDLAQEAIR